MKFKCFWVVLIIVFFTTTAFSQLQINKIKYRGLALWDSIPTFPGGDTALTAYWNVDLKSPDADTACKVHGTVYIEFWVESSGHIMEINSVEANSNFPKDTPKEYIDNCIKPTEAIIVENALELAQRMPRWNATISKNGMQKRCKVTLPIYY